MFLAKLAESSLNGRDAKRMSLTLVTEDEVKKKYPKLPLYLGGFVIPYFDENGRRTTVYRFRYLQVQPSTGFGALTLPPSNPRRYSQEKGSKIDIYLAPFLDWQKIFEDPTEHLIITEGELKAACATKLGLPTIGLGGVWNFRSKDKRLLPRLKAINWKDRRVYICYDSDANSNPHVAQAENVLAEELLNLGAHVYIARIPRAEQ